MEPDFTPNSSSLPATAAPMAELIWQESAECNIGLACEGLYLKYTELSGSCERPAKSKFRKLFGL